MKKLLFTLVLLLSSVVGNAQTFMLGDVNKDGQVTIADVMMVVDIVMNGYKPLTLSSENVVVDYGSLATVNISSGYGPYTVTCSDENLVEVSLDGTQLSITGKAVGTAVVTVTDTATGYTKDINVTVNAEPLTISNNTVEVTAGESATVEITSGSGNYSVGSSDTSVATATVSNGIVTITSVSGGAATITVTDTQSGQTATIEVTVAHQPLALASNSVSLFIGDEGSVEITSGSGSYSVESSDDNVVFAELDGNAVSILAFGVGSATITVTDTQSGQTATIEVTVDYLPLELSISSLTLTMGEESTASITSGNGFFTVRSSDTGVATASLSGTSIKVTAVGAGTATITVTDRRSGQTATIEVTVEDNQPQSYLTCPDDYHPHLIDLGLPSGTKWACCNVDTDHPENQSPENYGGYYAWGETETKSTYNWSTYIHCDGSDYTCKDLGSDIAGTEYDVVHVKWGGSWVMPTKDQQDELRNNCTYEWTTENGVNGGKFTSKKNGGSIFLPAVGYRYDSILYIAGLDGNYWSSTQDPSSANSAYVLCFGSGGTGTYFETRGKGFTVRPVSRN